VAKPVARRGRRPSPREAAAAAQPALVDSEEVAAVGLLALVDSVVAVGPQAEAEADLAVEVEAVAAGDAADDCDADNDLRRGFGFRAPPYCGSGTGLDRAHHGRGSE
jgi:hypothetical protein